MEVLVRFELGPWRFEGETLVRAWMAWGTGAQLDTLAVCVGATSRGHDDGPGFYVKTYVRPGAEPHRGTRATIGEALAEADRLLREEGE